MRHEPAGIGLAEAFLDLRDETPAFNRVLNGRLLGEALGRVDASLLLRSFHAQNLSIVDDVVSRRCAGWKKSTTGAGRSTSVRSCWGGSVNADPS